MKIVNKKNSSIMLGIAVILIFALPMVSHSFPIAAPGTEGLEVIVSGNDHVIATYQGNSASYSNDLYLNDVFIFNNQTSPVGSTVDLGTFAIGTELVFRLHVNNTGYDYYTGPASRNPDNHFHARVEENWQPGETLVSFEDLFNGPFDYNDLSFSFTNTSTTPPNSVPEPTTMLLLGSSLVGLWEARRKLKK
jgi:hypothetical protein